MATIGIADMLVIIFFFFCGFWRRLKGIALWKGAFLGYLAREKHQNL